MKRLIIGALLLLQGLAHAEVTVVEVENLKALLDRGVPIVDIRGESEWKETGVVPGSRKLTYFDDQGNADPAGWMKRFRPIAGPDDEVVIICRSGVRSRMVADYLDQQQHYGKVYTVGGGVIGWKALGNPTVRP